MDGKELKNATLFLALLMLSVTVQTTWIARHALFGATPDIVLILISCLGLRYGSAKSVPAGIAAGIVYGALGQHPFMTFFLWAIVGSAAGLSNNNIFIPSRSLAGMVAIAGTMLMFFLYWTFSALFLKEPFYTPWETPVISMLMNGALTYLIYPLFPATPDKRPTYE